jgi:hypothetical protein
MLIEESLIVTIKCDKCGKTKTATKDTYNDVFYKEKWALNKGRKYMHLCFDCLPKKKQKTFGKL